MQQQFYKDRNQRTYGLKKLQLWDSGRLGKVDFRRLVKGSYIDQSSQVGEGQAFKTMLNNSLHR